MDSVFRWVAASPVSASIRDSLLLTATLSAVHLLGMTLVAGGALVGNLRRLGLLLLDRPVVEITGPADRGIALGLLISVATGLLLFAPRAPEASGNRIFQVKMLLLLCAVLLQFGVHPRAMTRASEARRFALTGAAGLMLWLGVAAAGAAYILLE